MPSRAIPVAGLQPEKPHCPSCYSPFDGVYSFCPKCQFSFGARADRFPYDLGELRAIHDEENRLESKAIAKLERAIKQFETRFPQLSFHFILTQLPPGTDAREVGFWALNTARAGEAELRGRERRHALLLLIDRANRHASLTLGYGLDPHLGDDTARRLLDKALPQLQAGNFAGAAARIVTTLQKYLETAQREATYVAQRYEI